MRRVTIRLLAGPVSRRMPGAAWCAPTPSLVTLYSLVGRFAWRHRRAYAGAAVMLVIIAVLTVWIPRRIGHVIDGLVADRLTGPALALELAILLAMGGAIYLLRVGWRIALFSAAFRLGIELRTSLYDRLTLQGPAFFHGQRTGDLMALATNDVDAVEMAAGEACLAGFDGTLTLVLVVAMMTLGVDWRLGVVALLPFPLHGARLLADLHRGARRVARLARPLLRPQRARAGDRWRPCARCARWASRNAPRRDFARHAERAAGARLRRAEVGGGVRAGGGHHAHRGDGADAGARRLARVARRAHHRHAHRVHHVPLAAHLAHVRDGLGALADRARQGGLGAPAAGAACARCR